MVALTSLNLPTGSAAFKLGGMRLSVKDVIAAGPVRVAAPPAVRRRRSRLGEWRWHFT
ncbi:MAG: hypothetical protein WA858_07190 [Xanthobacteraceae bacterium]|jgi:hypothetical protein